MEEVIEKKQDDEKENFFVELVKLIIISAVIVFPIRIFIAQPFIVSGASMDPTFEDGHYLIVDEISYRFKDPKRNDVIVFKYPKDTSKYFIKRIIGLPTETVEIKDGKVTIKNIEHPDGFPLNEDYLDKNTYGDMTISLNKEEYFVLGDNRDRSSDSRIWGVLPKNLIVGRALLRLFPFSEVEILPGSLQN